jgi:phosphoglycerol transferase MdoB-like AlkP superfamily enzyme
MTKGHPQQGGFFIDMFKRIQFLILLLFGWLSFFELARIIFLLVHRSLAKQLSSKTVLLTFVYGLRMDLSMACYVLLLTSLFVILSIFLPFFRRAIIYNIFTGIVLFVFLLMVFTDVEIFTEWGYRLDATVLQYLSSPKEVLASAGHLPLFWIVLVFLLLFGGLFFAFNKLIQKGVVLLCPKQEQKFLSALLMVCFTALLIIPIRGGIQMQPMNPSWVYFSSNEFANVSALNAPWNFFQDVLDNERTTSNPYIFLPTQKATEVVDSLYTCSHTHQQLIDTSAGKPNVIVIVWESFTAKATWLNFQGKEITPNINRLKSEGIYFSNFYASGDRTHKGMSAVFSGYPALPNTSIIRFPKKSSKLTLISNLFKQHGYSSTFFYGGDPNYDNYKSYLLHGNFDEITGEGIFNQKDKITEWGIADGAVANYMTRSFSHWKQPFFNCWLTLTSHVPYKIPVPPTFVGDDETTKFLNSVHYTDQVIGRFIDNCKKQPWWKNTVVIITADHGIRFPATGKVVNDFRIPMLWLGGAVEKKKGMIINKLASQLDISATLSKQMGWNASLFPFGRDITDSTQIPFTFFSNSTSFGLVEPTKYFVFDVKGNRIREQEGNVQPKDLDAGKALQQFIYNDYLKK